MCLNISPSFPFSPKKAIGWDQGSENYEMGDFPEMAPCVSTSRTPLSHFKDFGQNLKFVPVVGTLLFAKIVIFIPWLEQLIRFNFLTKFYFLILRVNFGWNIKISY